MAADLVEALNAPGPLTVFAPTNDAFGALLGG
ncbi:MAG: fasciclin domain-containing protein [Burkholderiaceae bacterium]